MLLKTPSLSPLMPLLLLSSHNRPVCVGQDPVRSSTPFASLKNSQPPKLHGKLPPDVHSAPRALLRSRLRHRAKSVSAAPGSPLSCIRFTAFCITTCFRSGTARSTACALWCCCTTKATPHTPTAFSTRSTRRHPESCVWLGAGGGAVEETLQSTRPVLT